MGVSVCPGLASHVACTNRTLLGKSQGRMGLQAQQARWAPNGRTVQGCGCGPQRTTLSLMRGHVQVGAFGPGSLHCHLGREHGIFQKEKDKMCKL